MNVAYTGPFFVLAELTASLKARMWSTVARPFFPPACASVIWAVVVALLLTIRSNSLPTLLASVIPLPLEHFPLTPLAFVESDCVSSLALLGDYSLYYDVIEHFQVHFSGVFVGLYENFIWDIFGSPAFSLFEWFYGGIQVFFSEWFFVWCML